MIFNGFKRIKSYLGKTAKLTALVALTYAGVASATPSDIRVYSGKESLASVVESNYVEQATINFTNRVDFPEMQKTFAGYKPFSVKSGGFSVDVGTGIGEFVLQGDTLQRIILPKEKNDKNNTYEPQKLKFTPTQFNPIKSESGTTETIRTKGYHFGLGQTQIQPQPTIAPVSVESGKIAGYLNQTGNVEIESINATNASMVAGFSTPSYIFPSFSTSSNSRRTSPNHLEKIALNPETPMTIIASTSSLNTSSLFIGSLDNPPRPEQQQQPQPQSRTSSTHSISKSSLSNTDNNSFTLQSSAFPNATASINGFTTWDSVKNGGLTNTVNSGDTISLYFVQGTGTNIFSDLIRFTIGTGNSMTNNLQLIGSDYFNKPDGTVTNGFYNGKTLEPLLTTPITNMGGYFQAELGLSGSQTSSGTGDVTRIDLGAYNDGPTNIIVPIRITAVTVGRTNGTWVVPTTWSPASSDYGNSAYSYITIIPIPEPGAGTLVAGALAAAYFLRKRKKYVDENTDRHITSQINNYKRKFKD